MALDDPVQQRWTLDSIDWPAVREDPADEPEALFYMVAAASFMESTTDRYTRNLVDQFAGDDEITDWLDGHWLPEELQHGLALRRYVEIAWPDFDWDRVYAAFLDEFSAYCDGEGLEPTRGREMASRCAVEMGTASYYTTLSRVSPDPVLATIARHIAEDEIRHYKHFYRHFRRYVRREGQSRLRLVRTLIRRLLATRSEDGRCAYRHVWDFAPGSQPGMFEADYRAFSRNLTTLVCQHAPAEMLTRMILKPLDLPPRAVDVATHLRDPLRRLWLSAGP